MSNLVSANTLNSEPRLAGPRQPSFADRHHAECWCLGEIVGQRRSRPGQTRGSQAKRRRASCSAASTRSLVGRSSRHASSVNAVPDLMTSTPSTSTVGDGYPPTRSTTRSAKPTSDRQSTSKRRAAAAFGHPGLVRSSTRIHPVSLTKPAQAPHMGPIQTAQPEPTQVDIAKPAIWLPLPPHRDVANTSRTRPRHCELAK